VSLLIILFFNDYNLDKTIEDFREKKENKKSVSRDQLDQNKANKPLRKLKPLSILFIWLYLDRESIASQCMNIHRNPKISK